MEAGEAFVVALAVHGDVLAVHLGHLGHAVVDDELVAARLSGFLEGEVGVAAGAVPVA